MTRSPALRELEDVFEELDTLLKNPDVGAELADRGVNVSLAMTLADGLRAYLNGDKEKALLELGTATDEIAARMTWSGGAAPS
jgi:predicted naringenin-chalcone synthase